MAVRGVLSYVAFYPRNGGGSPIKVYQNHFQATKTINGQSASYKPFTLSSLEQSKNRVTSNFSITFAAVGDLVDFVDEAIFQRYFVDARVYRWGQAEGGIDSPTTFQLYARGAGNVEGGSSDFITATMDISTYAKTVNADFPGRKIAWDLLMPITLRR